jgi:AAA+ ATPase superfamily predicted ATPase
MFEDTASSFLIRYANVCLLSFLRWKGRDEAIFEDSPDSLKQQIVQAVELKPALASHLFALSEALAVPPELKALEMTLALPQSLVAGQEAKMAVLIDEFQNVAFLSLPVVDFLRRRILTDTGVSYIIAGSEVGMMKEILESSQTPLLGHFDVQRVGAFSVEQSREYILKRLRDYGLVIGELGLSFLVTLTGGFPFFMNVLLAFVVRRCSEKGFSRVSSDIILEAIEKESFQTDGMLFIHFKDTLEGTFRRRNMGRYLQIMKAIALGNPTLTAIAKGTGMRATSLPTYMDFLQLTELVKKTEAGYQLTQPYMDFWLRACYRVQESSALGGEEKLNAFRSMAQALLQSLKTQLGKAREAQIREMFFLSDEYTDTRGGMLDGEEFDLITYKEGQLLVGEVKTGDVTVADVLSFSNKVERISASNTGGKMLFLLGTISAQAIDAAGDYGIELWDLTRINAFRRRLGLERLSI